MVLQLFVRAVTVLILLSALSLDGRAATLTVTGAGDGYAVDGACTLHEAVGSVLLASNFNADCTASGSYGTADTINFNIPGAGVHTINMSTPLPRIVVPVFINGYSQPGAVPNSSVTGWNGTILIELNSLSGAGIELPKFRS